MGRSTRFRTPGGFLGEEVPGGMLLLRETRAGDLSGRWLRSSEEWDRAMQESSPGPGRGRTARLDLGGGTTAVLKRMRRGGMLGPACKDRFLGTRRLLANLTVPLEARARGIPTPEPLAMLLLASGAGTYRAWLATEEVGEAVDLLSRMKREPAPDLDRIRCVLETVRALHDAGLRHRDLNLANLLVRESGGGWEVHVIDLDRGALAEGPLPYRARLASLRRLERSYEKHVGRNGPLGADPGLLWYSLYAGEDGPLAGRLEASRRVGRILLALHRLTW